MVKHENKYINQTDAQVTMFFSFKELAVLNEMISVALLSGKIDFNETSESIHKKIAKAIRDCIGGAEMLKSRDMIGRLEEPEKEVV